MSQDTCPVCEAPVTGAEGVTLLECPACKVKFAPVSSSMVSVCARGPEGISAIAATIELTEAFQARFRRDRLLGVGDHDEVPISIATEARRLAGFTDEEIARLIKTTQRSPVY